MISTTVNTERRGPARRAIVLVAMLAAASIWIDTDSVVSALDTPVFTPVGPSGLLGDVGPGGTAACPAGSLMTGVTVYRRTGGSNQLRVVVPRCQQVIGVPAPGSGLTLDPTTVDAGDLGNRSPGVLAPLTSDCGVGSAVTGLRADEGLSIDRISIRCSTFGANGSVQGPVEDGPFIGGPSAANRRGPVDCVASFGTGVYGPTGDDIDGVGLLCAAVSVTVVPPPPPPVPPTDLTVDITSSTSSAPVGVAAIDISSLPASVFQGYGGPTADYARSELQTIDLRTDTSEATPVADVTLDDLALDTAPVTRDLLATILLSDIPIEGGWSQKLRPNQPPLVEQTLTLLDVYRDYASVLPSIRLGDLGLQASNLGSISTYAALLAGVPVTQLPVPGSSNAIDYWCGLVSANGLNCATDFDTTDLTLPVLSFAGVDVEQAEFLGAEIDGSTDVSGTPIGTTLLGALDIGAVPLASQPLVPSKSLPSYLPSTLDVPQVFQAVTLGELGPAAPLGALTPAGVGLSDSTPVSALNLEFQPDSPLADYSWVAPAAGASLLVSSEQPLAPAIASIPVGDLGLNAPVLSVPLDEIDLPNGRTLGSYRLVELLGGEADFGAAPFAASPFAASPFGAAPFAASSIGASPFRASPFRASPFRASPFRASPFAASPFRASDIGSTPFRASPFRASPFRASPFAASTFGVSPFRASPFRASPFRASPLDTSPFRASPFRASPLSELGLSAPITAIPLDGLVDGRSLGSYRLADLDPSSLLFGVPLEPFVGWEEEDGTPVFDCTVIDCRQPNGFTLGQGIESGALPSLLTLADVQPGLFGLRLADLIAANPAFTEQSLRTFSAAVTMSLGDAAEAGFSPDGIPIELFSKYQDVTISDERLVFSGWRLVDLAGLAEGLDFGDLEAAVASWAATNSLMIGDLTGKIPVAQDGLAADELWVDTLALSTLVNAKPDLTVGDVWPLLRPLRLEHLRTASDQPLSVQPSAAFTTIGFILTNDPPYPTPSRLEGLLWGDIVGSAGTDPITRAATFAVADVIGAFAGVTLGEFLRAAQPITDRNTEEIDLSAIDLADYATGATVSFDVAVAVVGGNRPQSARIVVTLPDGARYVPESAALRGFTLDPDALAELEPTTFGNSLVWQIANIQPGSAAPTTLTFATRSSEKVGTFETSVSAQVASTDLFASDSTSVQYREALEPNNTPSEALAQAPIETGQLVLSQVSSATDVDIFAFEVTDSGQRIGGVLSNLPADYDLTIIGPGIEPLAATGGRIRESVGDRDTSILGGATSSTLTDGGQYQPPAALAVIARSTSRGTATESIPPVPTFVEGTYYLVVSGYDGASGAEPYALRLLSDASVVAAPVCPAPAQFPNLSGTAPALDPLPIGIDTLFVVNHDRLARQYGDAAADGVLAEIDILSGALAGGLSGLGLKAGTIDLGANATLDSAYDAWDETPCDVALANDVVRETTRVLRGVYTAHPDIENVVLVGSDRIIPFARISDRTLIGNEQSYASTFADDISSPLYAALQAGTYFSDDPFVDTTPTLVNDRALYVAEKAVGRLVENPDEIVGQLRTFVQRSGTIRVDSATVAGYDFLADSSEAIAELLAGPIEADVDVDLIREDWTALELAAKFFPETGSTPGIGVINGHFSHQGTQSALGSATSNEDEALFVDDIGDANFTGSLLFTVGCHSGLTADEFIPGALGASWAESLAGAGASAYIAQSGFGYGSTDSIQLTERLLTSFASRLDGNYTIGEALTLAKNEYLAPLSAISVYDEKSLQQAILYGLPFSTPDVASPPPPATAPSVLTLVDSPIPGLRTATLNPEFEITRATRDRGVVFEIDGQSYAPQGQPLQPITSVDATGPDGNDAGTDPDARLHGALLVGGVAYTAPGSPIDPVYNTPTINRGAVEPEIQPIDAAFPISPIGVSDAMTEFGLRDFVGIQPGRFTATQPDGRGTQVLYDDLTVRTLHSSSDDWVAPTIGSVNETVANGAFAVTVTTPSDNVAGVVVAVVENLPGATEAAPVPWRTFDLLSSGAGRWSGGIALAACSANLEYLVQIYDTAGNVRVMSNKAAGFTTPCAGSVGVPGVITTIEPTNFDGGAGVYSGPVTVTVGSGLPGLAYSIDGGAFVPVPAAKSFQIVGGGRRTFVVTAANSSATSAGAVTIDDAPPQIQIQAPAGDVIQGALFTVLYTCTDSTLASCTATLAGPGGTPATAVTSGQEITGAVGAYTLTVTATDAISTRPPATLTRAFTGVRALQAVPRSTNLEAASGWYTGPVTVDILSPLPGPFSYRINDDNFVPVPTATPTPNFTFTGVGVTRFDVSAAGNPTTDSGEVRIDTGNVPPSITITAPGAFQTVQSVPVAFSCTDPSLTTCAGLLTGPSEFSQPVTSDQTDPVPVPVDGVYTLTVTADDAVVATGPSEASRSVTVDTVRPTITCPAAPPSFLLNKSGATLTATVTDAGSGPVSSSLTQTVTTGTVGLNSVSFDASDRAGNTATLRCNYNVGYRFDGFQSPLSITAVNNMNAGRTVPVKWRIADANGVGVASPASFVSLRLVASPCIATSSVTVSDVGIDVGIELRYNGDGNWQYNWKTPRNTTGCFDLQLRLADTNVPRIVEVRLR